MQGFPMLILFTIWMMYCLCVLMAGSFRDYEDIMTCFQAPRLQIAIEKNPDTSLRRILGYVFPENFHLLKRPQNPLYFQKILGHINCLIPPSAFPTLSYSNFISPLNKTHFEESKPVHAWSSERIIFLLNGYRSPIFPSLLLKKNYGCCSLLSLSQPPQQLINYQDLYNDCIYTKVLDLFCHIWS